MICLSGAFLSAQEAEPETIQSTPAAVPDTYPQLLGPLPLYEGAIPNSVPGPDQEEQYLVRGMAAIRKISRPTITVYLPAVSGDHDLRFVAFLDPFV